MLNNKDPKQAMSEVKHLVFLCKSGAMAYDEAKLKADKLLEIVNARGREIARKYGVRHKNIIFTALIR